MISLDTETTGLDWHRNKVTHVGMFNGSEFEMRDIDRHIGWHPATHKIIMHHGRFDTLMLHGTTGGWTPWDYDTMLLSQLYDERVKHSLNNIGQKYVGEGKFGDKKILQAIKKGEFWTLPQEVQTQYLRRDCELTYKLFEFFKSNLSHHLWNLYENFDQPISIALAEIERNGFTINTELLSRYRSELEEKICGPLSILRKEFGPDVNLHSPAQLLPVLRRYTGFDLEDTDERTLMAIARYSPIVKVLLQYREYFKYLNTYVDGINSKGQRSGLAHLIVDGKVYPSFHLAGDYHESKGRGTATGRTSSSNPNLQNQPRANAGPVNIRSLFISSDGHVLLAADYSQIELRVASFLSKETNLGSGDLHAEAGRILGRDRATGKTANFALIYGAKESKLRYISGGSPHVREYVKWFRDNFPRAVAWTESIIERAKEEKKVETYLGRVRHLDRPEIGPNSIVQGSAADIAKEGLLRVHDAGYKILGIIHDELIVEVPRKEKLLDVATDIQRLMTSGLVQHKEIHDEVGLAVECKTGTDWGHMEALRDVSLSSSK